MKHIVLPSSFEVFPYNAARYLEKTHFDLFMPKQTTLSDMTPKLTITLHAFTGRALWRVIILEIVMVGM